MKMTFPSDFKNKQTKPEFIATQTLGPMGAMVGGSKSIYRYDNPKNLVLFNANICTENNGKIWYGDLDITKDYKKLIKLSKLLNMPIFILYEMDARFEKSDNPDLSKFVISFDNKKINFSKKYEKYFYLSKGVPLQLTDEECITKFPAPPEEKRLYDKEKYTEIDLPDLNLIKIKKDYSPLNDFQKHFIDKYGRDRAVEVYRNLHVTPDYINRLEALITKCIKKTYPNLHPVKVQQSVSMEMLQESPSHFIDKPDWADNNKGYVKINEEK
jgi:hypothetical protein